MEHIAALAVAKQYFERLAELCPPESIRAWNPNKDAKAAYIRLAEKVLAALDSLRIREQRELLTDAKLQSHIPPTLLGFLRDQIQPREEALRTALDTLDPEGKDLREMIGWQPREVNGKVMLTFEEGIDQIYQLLDRRPELEDEVAFLPESAYQVIDSKLIQFDPDAWLARVDDLGAVRTSKENLQLPMHIRLRLEELYRVYVFGCWLSVFGLARAILEYAIVENIKKFGLETHWPADRDGRRKEKKLSQLVDELGEKLPNQARAMGVLRDRGNEFMHPKRSQVSKESMLQRRSAAKEVVALLVEVIEAIYFFDAA